LDFFFFELTKNDLTEERQKHSDKIDQCEQIEIDFRELNAQFNKVHSQKEKLEANLSKLEMEHIEEVNVRNILKLPWGAPATNAYLWAKRKVFVF
jgi:hypothetical protein